MNYGERSYGEMYAQAVNATGYENGTLRNAKWVSAKYELSARADNLSFKHHEIVAALPFEERTAILAEAARERWTCAELRQEMRHASAKAIVPIIGIMLSKGCNDNRHLAELA